MNKEYKELPKVIIEYIFTYCDEDTIIYFHKTFPNLIKTIIITKPHLIVPQLRKNIQNIFIGQCCFENKQNIIFYLKKMNEEISTIDDYIDEIQLSVDDMISTLKIIIETRNTKYTITYIDSDISCVLAASKKIDEYIDTIQCDVENISPTKVKQRLDQCIYFFNTVTKAEIESIDQSIDALNNKIDSINFGDDNNNHDSDNVSHDEEDKNSKYIDKIENIPNTIKNIYSDLSKELENIRDSNKMMSWNVSEMTKIINENDCECSIHHFVKLSMINFVNLIELYCSSCKEMNDKCLKQLCNLRKLNCSDCDITNKGIYKLTELQYLDCCFCVKIDDNAFKKLKKIKELYCDYCPKITDDVTKYLPKLVQFTREKML